MVRGSFFQWFPESSSKIMMAWSRFPPKAGSCSICSFHQMAFGGVWQLKIGSELCHRVGRSEGIRRLEEEASKRLERLYDAEGIDSMVQVEDLKLVRLAYVISTERMKNMLNQWQYELLHGGKAFSESFRISSQSAETVFYHMRPALSLKDSRV